MLEHLNVFQLIPAFQRNVEEGTVNNAMKMTFIKNSMERYTVDMHGMVYENNDE